MKKFLISSLTLIFLAALTVIGVSAETIPGDVNADGLVNSRDSATLLLYLNNEPVECDANAADTDGNGVITAADAERILKHLLSYADSDLSYGAFCKHALTFVAETAPVDGKIDLAHWRCGKCSCLFKDAEAQILINEAYLETDYVGDVHTHTEVRVPGTPATERGFGMTDYVYCSTCSEVISEQELILPLGIENPDYYASSWGYEYLGTLENGTAMQSYYKKLDTAISKYHSDAKATLTEYDSLDPVNYASLGLSYEEAITVYSLYRDDHPLYYWLSISWLYTQSSLYIVVDEDYREGEVRQSYNELVYAKAAEYLEIVKDETSEYQIAFGLHDAICANASYAYKSDGKTPEDANWAHSIIGILEKNAGVCESFTEVFGMLLNFREVENIRVSGYGNGGSHAWNLVKLDDGKWYWYDVTWGDQDWSYHNVIHLYFCVNDTEARKFDFGSGYFNGVVFLDKHVPEANRTLGKDYNPVLPERSSTSFTTDDTMLYDTFTLDGTTYKVIGYDTVICSSFWGISSTPPETLTYNGRKYKVIVGD
ncbi:MAG: hypothetical protein IJY97_09015 [Clostridia bacterium]|nr:hypothetical protein [Clostridia bacterium]